MRVAPAWTLGILAGGFSRRLGRDKAEIELGGETLLRRAARRLAPEGVPVLVGTRRDGPGRDQGFQFSLDYADGEGPLSGIAGLLGNAVTPFVLVVPCDLPFLPVALGDRLLSYGVGVDAVVLKTSSHIEPLPVLLARDAGPRIQRLLEEGKRRVDSLLDLLPSAVIPFHHAFPADDDGLAFLNLNTEADLKVAAGLIANAPER